jgi:hypothetical protein
MKFYSIVLAVIALVPFFSAHADSVTSSLFIEGQKATQVLNFDVTYHRVCYTGDVASAKTALDAQIFLSGEVLDGRVIRYSERTSVCTSSEGEYDDAICTSSSPVTSVNYVGPCSEWNHFVINDGTISDEKNCVPGDLNAAAKNFAILNHVKTEVLGNDSFRYRKNETRCVESVGEYEDNQCLRSKTKSVYHYVESCALVNHYGDFKVLNQ